MIRASVVVPTCGRPELLDRCLAALVAQDLDPSAYEVIVVDDAPSAATRRVVERRAGRGRPRLRYLALDGPRGPAAARNRGWRAARGEIVAFTDDDCVPAPDWLRWGLAAFRDGVAGAAGRVVVPLPPEPTDYQWNFARLEIGEFVTANCFYRRSAIAAVGGFDERFRVPWREDSDLFFTLLERGARLVRAPAAVVVHPLRPAAWGVSVSEQRKSRFNALLYKKHPGLYRQRIQRLPPLHYYGAVLAALAGLAGALARRPPLALGGAGAWLALTGGLCVARLRGKSRAPGHVLEMLVTSALIPPLSVYWRLRGALEFRTMFF